MKKSILCVAALIVAAIVSVTVVSCKKDKDEVVKATNSEAQALLNRIEAFQTLRDAVNSGVKEDGSMTVEEMRQTLDLVSNYEHSEHMTYCDNSVLDTLHVAMPVVDGEYHVSSSDVVVAYNAFEAALEECMFEVNDGRDVPSFFSIKMPEIGAKENGDIEIIFTRGEAADDNGRVNGPFGKSDNLKWGRRLGYCDSLPAIALTDAAIELSNRFVAEPLTQPCLVFDPEYGKYTPYYDSLYLPGYIYYEDPTIQCADRWLYCISGEFEEEPCIDYEEMNCYYFSIIRNIVSSTGVFHYGRTYNSPYRQCIISAHHLYGPGYTERSVRVHVADVLYYKVVQL